MEFTVPGKGQYERSVIWPDRNLSESDRIVNQLNFKPRWVSLREENADDVIPKKILLYHGFGSWDVKKGGHTFREQKCLVDTCELTSDPKTQNSADAVLFRDVPAQSWQGRPIKQIWILFMLESPYHTASLQNFNNTFNWTATYRHDSDVTRNLYYSTIISEHFRKTEVTRRGKQESRLVRFSMHGEK
ncbi:hypothetical protein DPMN_006455 [Dreissena polymorpha]|uniref:Fucosyltransferase N-terminal domain-containing protein n=1 Tax=Dreissena polymorpha TaxID=45954 RepID=A0A9D4MSF6_DREPO|nr:hypothetical protein DPMN_006455 [Dreissena polymorpha]